MRLRVREFIQAIKCVKAIANFKEMLMCLDVGCGSGIHSYVLKKLGKKIIALDITRSTIFYLENFMLASAEHLPFRNEVFDVILVSHVLEHVKRKIKALLELKRVLKPHGILIVIVPTPLFKCLTLLLWPRDLIIEIFQLSYGKTLTINKLIKGISPKLHGSFSSHKLELAFYRMYTWRNILKKAGLQILYEKPLFPYYFTIPLNIVAHFMYVKPLNLTTSYLFICRRLRIYDKQRY